MIVLLAACTPPAPTTADSGAPAPTTSAPTTPAPTTPAPTTTEPAPAGCAVDRWDPADFATVIDVGSGYAAATPSDVPWESITAGTLVRIWPGVYHDKWVIAAAGTEADPVVVIGVCDPETGALPVIDGAGAQTRLALDFWSEGRGVVKIGGSSVPSAAPNWVYLEDLEIRGARASNTFVDHAGAEQSYGVNGAAVYLEMGEHVTIRGCTLTDSGNGMFASHASRDVVVSGNHIHGNGNVGSITEHNNYTESNGITFEYNRFGPLCDGCLGNNLKDRSAGTVIRYNWIEGGNRQLDLVESDFADLRSEPSYRVTYVYGNVLIEPDGAGNSQLVHYGGDGGDVALYRRGTIYLYANTIVSERVGNTTWMRLSDEDESFDARNNVVWTLGPLAIVEGPGAVTMGTNWLVDWRGSFGGPVDVTDEGTNTIGVDPPFADLAARDLALAPGSAAIGAAGPLAEGAEPVLWQYEVHQGAAARADDADQGAFDAP